MLIKESNRGKIEAMIEEAQKRARERKVDFDDIVKALDDIEKSLGIAKKSMIGITADIDIHAQDFPKAYKYTPESTQVMLVRKTSGWDLISVERWHTRKDGHRIELKLTDEAKEAIIRKSMTIA